MMRRYDFVFLYEIKNRELESIMLLKYELIKRGYSVLIIETWNALFEKQDKIHAKAVEGGFALKTSGSDKGQTVYMLKNRK